VKFFRILLFSSILSEKKSWKLLFETSLWVLFYSAVSLFRPFFRFNKSFMIFCHDIFLYCVGIFLSLSLSLNAMRWKLFFSTFILTTMMINKMILNGDGSKKLCWFSWKKKVVVEKVSDDIEIIFFSFYSLESLNTLLCFYVGKC
jgi:hypothetical protein